ncbi:maleylpyruvate isomerase family mycothiol-dependent enzyme [Nakamurella sp. GG22]
MVSTADTPIAALRSGHNELDALVEELSPIELDGPSAASEWTIAQVLSHLGSGAEIHLAAVETAVSGTDSRGPDFNQGVWDRWNAMTPQEQADGFLRSNEVLVSSYEALGDQARRDLRIDIGFLPQPIDVAGAAAFRLNEFALHSWDVRVIRDPKATVAPEAVENLLDVSSFMFGWISKPVLGRTVRVAVRTTEPDRQLGLEITPDAVSLTDVTGSDAQLTLPAESWLRLVAGRLDADHTPAAVQVSGDISLDELRTVFPGY